MASDTVREYYDQCGRSEWNELAASAYKTVGHLITMHYLKKYLPKGGMVLDAGGGPGRYTTELAKQGYDVVLLDMSEVQLGIAREELAKQPDEVRRHVVELRSGSIEDLSQFDDDAFDAVLCLRGMLSHMMEVEDREAAAGELHRVAAPGAPVFVSVCSFYGVLRRVLVEHQDDMHLVPKFLEKRLNPEGTGFTDCFYFTPEELVDLLARNGIEIVEYAGLQGLSAQLRQATEDCSGKPVSWEVWKEVLLRTCNHPSVVGVSDHILAVGFA